MKNKQWEIGRGEQAPKNWPIRCSVTWLHPNRMVKYCHLSLALQLMAIWPIIIFRPAGDKRKFEVNDIKSTQMTLAEERVLLFSGNSDVPVLRLVNAMNMMFHGHNTDSHEQLHGLLQATDFSYLEINLSLNLSHTYHPQIARMLQLCLYIEHYLVAYQFTPTACTKGYKPAKIYTSKNHLLHPHASKGRKPRSSVNIECTESRCKSAAPINWNLARHAKTHTQEKPFACLVKRCNEQYATPKKYGMEKLQGETARWRSVKNLKEKLHWVPKKRKGCTINKSNTIQQWAKAEKIFFPQPSLAILTFPPIFLKTVWWSNSWHPIRLVYANSFAVVRKKWFNE